MCPSLRFRNADGARCALRCVFATQVFSIFLEKFLSQVKTIFVSLHDNRSSITYFNLNDFRDGQYLRA